MGARRAQALGREVLDQGFGKSVLDANLDSGCGARCAGLHT